VVGWSDWISTCGSAAAVSIVVGEFSSAFLPGHRGQSTVISIASAVLIAFALVQWRSIIWGSTAQNITSGAKALLFTALIIAALIMGGSGSLITHEANATPSGMGLLVVVMLSLQAVIYTYDGWTGVIYFSEEVENPGRDIPRAMIVGVLSVTAIYMLVNLALLYVLPIQQIAGKDFAAGVAADAIFGRYGDTVFRIITIVSLLSTINACHLMASRVLFAMSRDGLFISRAATVNEGGTPTFSLFLTAVVGLLFVRFGETFERVISVMAFFFVAMYALSFISVFVLRWREPEKPRPFRAWGYPWTTGLALLGSVLFLAGAVMSDTRNSFYAGVLLVISYPVFRLVKISASN
jgi:APA family basic amino acid/polyamine antiporter